MKVPYALPFIIAQLPVAPDPWWTPLANFGIAGAVICWFMWRDKVDREERRAERADQERRHTENIAALRDLENAFRAVVQANYMALSGLKQLDAYKDMIERLKNDHENPNNRG